MKKHSLLKKGLGGLAAVVLIAAALVADSRYRLQLTEYRLSFNNLPESFEGFRKAQAVFCKLAAVAAVRRKDGGYQQQHSQTRQT